MGEPVPGRPGRHRQPLLLLLVRARRSLDRVLLAAPRAPGLLRAGDERARPRARTAGSTPRVDAADLRRRDRSLGGRRSRTPTAPPRSLDARAVISAVGALNTPPDARHPGHGRRSRGRRSTPPAGTTPWITAASGSRSSAPAPAASRSRRRSPTRSSSSPCTNAPRSGCSRTRTTTARVPDGERWAIRHLPFYGRWFRFLTFYPGAGPLHRALPHRPDYDDGGLAVSAATG